MFDPFGDFATAGYLRNTQAEKRLDLIKVAEHALFRANLPRALRFLERRRAIAYADFLEVHRILFSDLYPWAGKDRYEVAPDLLIRKAQVYFCKPYECQRAIDEGLRLAQGKPGIGHHPGLVMGMFAFGHPFLDGNGRTMLLVHAELCFRAGMSVDWTKTDKVPYLEALTQELESPKDGHLDAYLKPFVAARIPREKWFDTVSEMQGLDGAETLPDEAVEDSDPSAARGYQAFEGRRDYILSDPGSFKDELGKSS